MRKTQEEYEADKIPGTFPALNERYFAFFFSRFVARRGNDLNEYDFPPFPAGIPETSELEKYAVQTGTSFIPFFR